MTAYILSYDDTDRNSRLGAAECKRRALPSQDEIEVDGSSTRVGQRQSMAQAGQIERGETGTVMQPPPLRELSASLRNNSLSPVSIPSQVARTAGESPLCNNPRSPVRIPLRNNLQSPVPIHPRLPTSPEEFLPRNSSQSPAPILPRVPTTVGESPWPRPWRRAAFTPPLQPNPSSPTPEIQRRGATLTPEPQPAFFQAPPANNHQGTIPSSPSRSSTPTPPLEPEYDRSKWPQHMLDAYQYFTQEATAIDDVSTGNARSWGDQWLGCVREFVEFQRRANFPDTGPSFSPAVGVRPPEIASWMKNRRPWKDIEIEDAEVFGHQWWNWWFLLQPGTRTCDENGKQLSPAINMDWSDIEKPGKNGFLLVMMALVWWGRASNAGGGWLEAVKDVSKVLHCINLKGEANGGVVGTKRGRGAEKAYAHESRKKRSKC